LVRVRCLTGFGNLQECHDLLFIFLISYKRLIDAELLEQTFQ